jgi:hypothetical protein
MSNDIKSSLHSLSMDFSSRFTQTRDDINLTMNNHTHKGITTEQISKRRIDSSTNIFEQELAKSDYRGKLGPTLKTTLFKEDQKNINSKTRSKIYGLQLPFMRRPLRFYINSSSISQIFFSAVLTIFSAFLYSFFWFSIEKIGSANVILNMTILSISFFIGTLLSFINNRISYLSFVFFLNFITTNFLLFFEGYLYYSQDIQKESNFTQCKFIFPALLIFGITSSFSYVSVIRAMASNFQAELKHFVNVIILTSTLLGLTLSSFSTSVLIDHNLGLLWATFIVGILGLFVSLFFRFKSKEPFTALQSPA